MGWFEEQIKNRKLSDEELLEDSFMKLASSVLGTKVYSAFEKDHYLSKAAIDDILKYFHKKPIEFDDDVTQITDRLDLALRPYGIMYRSIALKKGFYKDSFGPILAFDKDTDEAIALLPGILFGYTFVDPKTGKQTTLNARNETRFREDAYCFYRPLPLKKLKIVDLLDYLRQCLNTSDIAMVGITSYSKVVLRYATFIGFGIGALSLVIGVIYLILKLIFWNMFRAGMAPMLIGMFFLGAVQLFFIGLVGEYILAINSRVLDRPLVVEEERLNFEDNTPQIG